MELSSSYRTLGQKHFTNTHIVANCFHVIRLIGHHLLACGNWTPVGYKSRGLPGLKRRHQHNLNTDQALKLRGYFKRFPSLEPIYYFKQNLSAWLLVKKRTRKQFQVLAPLVQLGLTLDSWAQEMGSTWRFTRSNGFAG